MYSSLLLFGGCGRVLSVCNHLTWPTGWSLCTFRTGAVHPPGRQVSVSGMSQNIPPPRTPVCKSLRWKLTVGEKSRGAEHLKPSSVLRRAFQSSHYQLSCPRLKYVSISPGVSYICTMQCAWEATSLDQEILWTDSCQLVAWMAVKRREKKKVLWILWVFQRGYALLNLDWRL